MSQEAPPSSGEKSPLERAFELFVYAPLGVVFTAREELPKLIDKGRRGAAGQVGMARVVGEFAVHKGQKEAEELLRRANERLADLGLVGDRQRPSPPSPPTASASGPADPPAPAPPAPASPATSRGPESPAAPGSSEAPASPASPASPAGLAIPGYDSLSAPQVVQRLDGLSAEELEAVRAYEAASRRRKTILGRVAQLQAAPGA